MQLRSTILCRGGGGSSFNHEGNKLGILQTLAVLEEVLEIVNQLIDARKQKDEDATFISKDTSSWC
eukprot:1740661-Amphidinium_carterae.1